MARVYTPLRYPGGKSKLTNFVKHLFTSNKLCDGHYIEPFAGGAGVAIELLLTEHVRHIHLNDLNLPLYAFWHSVIHQPQELCKKIQNCTVSVTAWRRHRNIVRTPEGRDFLELGFSLFFLNRTNRSGIIGGGVIGGLEQQGNYKIDARFTKPELIRRILAIAEYKHRIHIYNEDAEHFLTHTALSLPKNSLIYLDPPYYNKGQRLYDNHYLTSDHAALADVVRKLKLPWLVSYDNVPEIRTLYSEFRQQTYDLQYSAASSKTGSEVMIFSDLLSLQEENLAA